MLDKVEDRSWNVTVCFASIYSTHIHPGQQDNLFADVSSYYFSTSNHNSTDRSDDRKTLSSNYVHCWFPSSCILQIVSTFSIVLCGNIIINFVWALIVRLTSDLGLTTSFNYVAGIVCWFGYCASTNLFSSPVLEWRHLYIVSDWQICVD
jgi:hypothetical protein